MKKQKYLFEEVIDEIREMYLQGGDQIFYREAAWCLYSKTDKLNLKSECFVLPYPEIDDDDNEILPEFAVQNGLNLFIVMKCSKMLLRRQLMRTRTSQTKSCLRR